MNMPLVRKKTVAERIQSSMKDKLLAQAVQYKDAMDRKPGLDLRQKIEVLQLAERLLDQTIAEVMGR